MKTVTIFDKVYVALDCTVNGKSIKTEPCPFCGVRHSHGTGGDNPVEFGGFMSYGHRAAHCFSNVSLEIDGETVYAADGYYLFVDAPPAQSTSRQTADGAETEPNK